MKTKLFTILATLLATISLAEVKVNEFTMPPCEAIPYSPVVCGDWAAAELKMIYGWGETLGIMAFDIKAKEMTKIFTGKAWGLAMTGTLVMWRQPDEKNPDSAILSGYDLAAGKPWTPAYKDGADPVAFGDQVVYECNGQICLYSIKSGTRRRISDERRVHGYPNVCGDMIVWLEREGDDFKKSRIRGYRISTGQEYLFSDQYEGCSRPKTDGHYVVWQTRTLCSFAHEIKTRKTRIVRDALVPSVSDGIMVYEKAVDLRNIYRGFRYVCGIDLRANGEEFRISKGVGVSQFFVNGNRVVWNESKVLHVADLTRN